jgi:hypothetical protein
MRFRSSVLFALLAGLSIAGPAQAATITLSLDTTPLITGTTAPYFINLQLVDGDGLVNNTVAVSNFDFGGGGAVGLPVLTGDVIGDLGSTVVLGDTAFFNDFFQQFTPGAFLSFDVEFSTNFVAPTPDRFTFAILNSGLVEVPTTGAGNELFGIDLRTPVTLERYPGLDVGSGDPILDAPVVVSAVPEPAGLVLLAAGAWAVGRRGMRRSR